MPSKRMRSLHHNIGFQDPYESGKNVPFHREHRSKKGRSYNDYHNSLAYKIYKKKKKGEVE